MVNVHDLSSNDDNINTISDNINTNDDNINTNTNDVTYNNVDVYEPYQGYYKVPFPNFYDNNFLNPSIILNKSLEIYNTNKILSKKINILQRSYASQLLKQSTLIPLHNKLVRIYIYYY